MSRLFQCNVGFTLLTNIENFISVYCWDLGLVLVSAEETNCTGVATGVYKITVLAYLNVPNGTQTDSIIPLLHLEEKEIKIIAFQVFLLFFS